MANLFLVMKVEFSGRYGVTLIPMWRDKRDVPEGFYPKAGTPVTVHLAGIGTIQSFTTDQNRFGKGLRDKKVRKFYRIHGLQAYDSIVIEKLGEWEYSIYPYRG